MQVTAFASAARTATPTAVTLATHRAKALFVVIDETAHASTPSVVFSVYGKDTTSGQEFLLLASAAVTTEGTTTMQIGMGLPTTANLSANKPIPDAIVLRPVHGDADSTTYSVAVHIVR